MTAERLTAPLWDRLRRFNPINAPVMVTHLIFISLTGVAYDSFQSPDPNRLFLVGLPLSAAAYFAVFLILLVPLRRMAAGTTKAILTALSIVAAYLAHSAAIFWATAPDVWIDLFVNRLPGDITAAITYYWIMVGIVSTGLDDLDRAEAAALKAGRELERQRARRLRAAKDFDAALRDRIEAALVNELKSLVAAVRAAGDKLEYSAIASTIRKLVEDKVRPLSKGLALDAKRLEEKPVAPVKPKRRMRIPRAKPSRDNRAWIVYFIAAPNFFATAVQNSDWLPALIVTGATIGVPITNWLVGIAFRQRTISLLAYLPLISLQSALGYLPAFFLINFFSQDFPALVVLELTGLTLFITVGFLGTTWGALFFAQRQRVLEAERINEEIQHELALIDQSLWMVQRHWTFVVHGTVQSSLNVAAARLIDQSTAGSVQQALESIEGALQSIQTRDQVSKNVPQLLQEIADTWDGVCKFEYQITPSVLALVEGKDGPATCLVEIAKELVGNANRHGRATKVWLTVYPNNQGDLEVISGNNGLPIAQDAKPGLGIQLFEELTKDFHFEQMKLGGFHATIAMPR